jgi:hypothetical protein
MSNINTSTLEYKRNKLEVYRAFVSVALQVRFSKWTKRQTAKLQELLDGKAYVNFITDKETCNKVAVKMVGETEYILYEYLRDMQHTIEGSNTHIAQLEKDVAQLETEANAKIALLVMESKAAQTLIIIQEALEKEMARLKTVYLFTLSDNAMEAMPCYTAVRKLLTDSIQAIEKNVFTQYRIRYTYMLNEMQKVNHVEFSCFPENVSKIAEDKIAHLQSIYGERLITAKLLS